MCDDSESESNLSAKPCAALLSLSFCISFAMSDNDINDYPLPSLQKHSSSHGAHTETQPRSAAGVKSAQDNASVAQSKVKLEAEIEELERRIEKNEPVEADVEDVRYECVITLWLFYALCLRTLTALPPPSPTDSLSAPPVAAEGSSRRTSLSL